MRHETRTQALVVGAGPVGMLTALVLAKGGVQTEIVDRNQGPAARSYACALHPGTLRLLDQFGIACGLIKHGRRIDTVALYEGGEREAELRLNTLGGPFPFVLVVPQRTLEEHLEYALDRLAKVQVKWNHSLTGLERSPAGELIATIDKRAHTSRGYIVPDWGWMVERTEQRHAEFVLGTDGPHSLVRRLLGIEPEHGTAAEGFAIHEFTTDTDPGHELRLVLSEHGLGALWPLGDDRCRWMLQLADASAAEELPAKEFRALQIVEPEADRTHREQLAAWTRTHAPWFTGGVREIEWSVAVQFEAWRARSFGRERVWLAGDAGHQTGPVGMQGMNVGLREAVGLGRAVCSVIRDGASDDVLAAYGRARSSEWGSLLGLEGALHPTTSIPSWVDHQAKRLLPCLPASGPDLARLLKQVGLEFADEARFTSSRG